MTSNLYEFYHDADMDASRNDQFPSAVMSLPYQLVDEVTELRDRVRDLEGVVENGHE